VPPLFRRVGLVDASRLCIFGRGFGFLKDARRDRESRGRPQWKERRKNYLVRRGALGVRSVLLSLPELGLVAALQPVVVLVKEAPLGNVGRIPAVLVDTRLVGLRRGRVLKATDSEV